MTPAILKKLEGMQQRQQELSSLLSDAKVIADMNKFRELSKEYTQLEPVIKGYREYLEVDNNINDSNEILKTSNDPELEELAQEELKQLMIKKEQLAFDIKTLLLPKDPNDEYNVFLEIRAGTGGDEAAIFVGDLLRMYLKYAEKQSWKVEILSESESERGGFKEVITRISGKNVYSKLKFESGVHRVQRVPETEAQGRVHTSTITVAVFPEVEEVNSIEINPAELRIDTYRAQGAGGQHVNKTDSAVRITHIPTGTVVACQSERSQIQNRAKAMALLQSRILDSIQEKQREEQAQTRRDLVGTGKRAERIRTYNFPQGRATDHRINLTLYHLIQIMDGALDEIIEPLTKENIAKQLIEDNN